MRVAYLVQSIAPFRIGGMQAVARMHVEGLCRRGHEVLLVRGSLPDEPSGPPPAAGLTEVPLPWPRGGAVRRRLPAQYPGELVRFSAAAWERIRDREPDVVYAEGPVAADVLRRPRTERPPVVFHPHGLETEQRLPGILPTLRSLPLRPLVRVHARRAERVISQGGVALPGPTEPGFFVRRSRRARVAPYRAWLPPHVWFGAWLPLAAACSWWRRSTAPRSWSATTGGPHRRARRPGRSDVGRPSHSRRQSSPRYLRRFPPAGRVVRRAPVDGPHRTWRLVPCPRPSRILAEGSPPRVGTAGWPTLRRTPDEAR